MSVVELLRASGHEDRGKRRWRFSTEVFESNVTTSRFPDDAGEVFIAALALTLSGRRLSRTSYALEVDDYFPPGDMKDAERRLNADAIAAIEGLRRGELRANSRPEALEMLIPRALDWVAVGNERYEYGARSDLIGTEQFVDVRELTRTFRDK